MFFIPLEELGMEEWWLSPAQECPRVWCLPRGLLGVTAVAVGGLFLEAS